LNLLVDDENAIIDKNSYKGLLIRQASLGKGFPLVKDDTADYLNEKISGYSRSNFAS
jgi:hypothetical protein